MSLGLNFLFWGSVRLRPFARPWLWGLWRGGKHLWVQFAKHHPERFGAGGDQELAGTLRLFTKFGNAGFTRALAHWGTLPDAGGIRWVAETVPDQLAWEQCD